MTMKYNMRLWAGSWDEKKTLMEKVIKIQIKSVF